VFFWFFPEDHDRLREASASQIAAHRVLADPVAEAGCQIDRAPRR
jgi:hypothetical protein